MLYCTVYVDNLADGIGENELSKFFKDIELVNVAFGNDSLTQEFTGKAYCTFKSKREAGQALALDGKTCEGKGLSIKEVPRSALVLNTGVKAHSSGI